MFILRGQGFLAIKEHLLIYSARKTEYTWFEQANIWKIQ